jgi:hypothetical protein
MTKKKAYLGRNLYVPGIVLILLLSACGAHFFPYEESDEEWASEENLLQSLDELTGSWVSDDGSVSLSYTKEEAAAQLDLGSGPIESDLESLRGKRPLVNGEFLWYYEKSRIDGDYVLACPREGDLVINFHNYVTNEGKTYRLKKV